MQFFTVIFVRKSGDFCLFKGKIRSKTQKLGNFCSIVLPRRCEMPIIFSGNISARYNRRGTTFQRNIRLNMDIRKEKQ